MSEAGPFTQRAFIDAPGDADLETLMRFLIAARPNGGPIYLHLGDLLWGMRMHTQMNPARDHRLWFDARGELVGFVRFGAPSDAILQVRPDLRNRAGLEADMLAWATAEAQRRAAPDLAPPTTTAVTLSDEATLRWLGGQGYRPNGHDYIILARDLRARIEPPALAGGAVVRAMADEADFVARTELHRAVWAPSRVTLEGYRLTRTAPGYDPELDLAIVLPDGRFAAYAIVWLDAGNAEGEFEPVGAHPDLRRLGYGRDVLLAGMQRLQARGARRAIVYCTEANVPFYVSAGFGVVDRYIGLCAPAAP
ncbi:MAG: GNAT family N-acetyltransferase [Thermoflexales bacterium]|nr:GNAT family N-acetyltransferase [Thermoflexales bacterium]